MSRRFIIAILSGLFLALIPSTALAEGIEDRSIPLCPPDIFSYSTKRLTNAIEAFIGVYFHEYVILAPAGTKADLFSRGDVKYAKIGDFHLTLLLRSKSGINTMLQTVKHQRMNKES